MITEVACLRKQPLESVKEASAALHGKVKELRDGVKVVKKYHYLPNLLEEDPSRVSLLQMSDFHAMMILLQEDTRGNWKVLTPVIVCMLEQKPSLIHEILQPDKVFLEKEATDSILLNALTPCYYDLGIIKRFVVSPSMDQVVAVVNRMRFIIKEGWQNRNSIREGVVAMEILHTWRRTLVCLPNWQDCLQRWLLHIRHLTMVTHYTFSLLQPVLVLVLDLLKEGVNVNIAELLTTLEMHVLRLLKREWSHVP